MKEVSPARRDGGSLPPRRTRGTALPDPPAAGSPQHTAGGRRAPRPRLGPSTLVPVPARPREGGSRRFGAGGPLGRPREGGEGLSDPAGSFSAKRLLRGGGSGPSRSPHRATLARFPHRGPPSAAASRPRPKAARGSGEGRPRPRPPAAPSRPGSFRGPSAEEINVRAVTCQTLNWIGYFFPLCHRLHPYCELRRSRWDYSDGAAVRQRSGGFKFPTYEAHGFRIKENVTFPLFLLSPLRDYSV